MTVVPGDLDTDRQPPMTIPLRHFVVGLGFLVLGGLLGVAIGSGVFPGRVRLAHVHLLLAGWVCLTIMGAMTQFVPVWSGTELYSRRLASVQLPLVTVGLAGFAAGLLTGVPWLLPAFGVVMVLGFWTFVYNVARTLAGLDTYDVTERHFGLALGFFLALTILGVLLAVDLFRPLFGGLCLTRTAVLRAHATLAVFGAVLTTVLGALYQLATMFTQTELHGIDRRLRTFEAVGYPLGVVVLATGRLFDVRLLGVVGGILVVGGLVAFATILARKLHETRVGWTPMLSRYAVLPPAILAWALLTLPAWLRRPLSSATVFGAPGTVHLLTLGAVGFVVLGTLYHVVPFIVWMHEYADRLGHEAVPMIEDLYDDRIATADLALFLGGTACLVAADFVSLPPVVPAVGGILLLAGTCVFLRNVLGVIRDHSPHSVGGMFAPTQTGDGSREATTDGGPKSP